MPDIALVSADIGGYDSPPVRFPQEDCDEHWLNNVAALNGEHPRMTAKRVKLLNVLPPGDYQYLIWADAGIHIRNPWFALQAASECGDKPLAQWRHYCRDDLVDEAVASVELHPEKYDNRVLEQAAHYTIQGVPKPSGLWAGGVIVWNLDHPDTHRFAMQWLAECQRWSWQDQVSEPFILWRMGLEPAALPYDMYANPWLIPTGHLRPD